MATSGKDTGIVGYNVQIAVDTLGTAKTSAVDAASHPHSFFTQPGPIADMQALPDQLT